MKEEYIETITWQEYLQFLKENATTNEELKTIETLSK